MISKLLAVAVVFTGLVALFTVPILGIFICMWAVLVAYAMTHTEVPTEETD